METLLRERQFQRLRGVGEKLIVWDLLNSNASSSLKSASQLALTMLSSLHQTTKTSAMFPTCSLRAAFACASDSLMVHCIRFPRPPLTCIPRTTHATVSISFFDILFIWSMAALKKASVHANGEPPTSDVSSAGGRPSTSEDSSTSAPVASAHEHMQFPDICLAFPRFAAHQSFLRSICTRVSSASATFTSADERVPYPKESLPLHQFATHSLVCRGCNAGVHRPAHHVQQHMSGCNTWIHA